MDRATAGRVIAGAGIGTALPFLLRQHVDDRYSIEQLGNWGKPSVLVGIISGIAGIGLGLTGRVSERIADFLVSYGVPALIEGILFGIYPKQTTATGAARIPAVRATAVPIRVSRPVVRTTAPTVTPTVMISE